MSPRTVLYPVHTSQPDSDIDAAIAFCRALDAHLMVLLIEFMPPVPIATDTVIMSDSWAVEVQEARNALAARAKDVTGKLRQTDISADTQSLLVARSGVEHAFSRYAMLSDLVISTRGPQYDVGLAAGVQEGTLFQSGKPLLVATAAQLAKMDWRRILVAWDNEKPASMAVTLAIPFLQRAEAVDVLVIDPEKDAERDGEAPGWDLATYLARHGAEVTVQNAHSGEFSISELLKSRAREVDAGLIVMGAYGHARLRQRLFGGTTRAILEDCELPVLMAH